MYQPRISNDNIKKLYQLKVQEKKPMTHVLDEILNKYFESHYDEMDKQKKAQKW